MITYDCMDGISKEAREELESIVNVHKTYSGRKYFFSPAKVKAQRRLNERRFMEANPDVTFRTPEGVVVVEMNYKETSTNVNYSLYVYVDGIPRDIRVIKKLLKLK